MELDKEELQSFKLVPNRPIGAQIYEYLRREITKTNIKPGTYFSENLLSAFFSVSRQPVREALMRLRMDGLLEVYPQRGSVVQKISVSNLRQICFIRIAIEAASIEHAPKLKPEVLTSVLQRLERNVGEQQTLKTMEDDASATFLDLDDAFHELICELSGCPMSWTTVQSIKGQMDRVRYLSQGKVSPYEQLIDEHLQILELLKAQDFAGAGHALRQHLSEILQTYIPIRQQYQQWFLPEDDDKLLEI